MKRVFHLVVTERNLVVPTDDKKFLALFGILSLSNSFSIEGKEQLLKRILLLKLFLKFETLLAVTSIIVLKKRDRSIVFPLFRFW